jgi:hypothetical protein
LQLDGLVDSAARSSGASPLLAAGQAAGGIDEESFSYCVSVVVKMVYLVVVNVKLGKKAK